MSAPRRPRAPRQPLFGPLSSCQPGAGPPALCACWAPPPPGTTPPGLRFPGALPDILPPGGPGRGPRHGLKRGRAELSPRGPAPCLVTLSGWTWTLTGAAWPTLTSEAPQGSRGPGWGPQIRGGDGLGASQLPGVGARHASFALPSAGLCRTLCLLWGPGHVASGPSARRPGFLGCVRTPRGPARDGRRAQSTCRADGPGVMDAGRRTQGRPQSRNRAAGGQAAGQARWAPPGSEGVGTGWAGGGEVSWPVDRGGAGLRSPIPGAGAAPRLWAGA